MRELVSQCLFCLHTTFLEIQSCSLSLFSSLVALAPVHVHFDIDTPPSIVVISYQVDQQHSK